MKEGIPVGVRDMAVLFFLLAVLPLSLSGLFYFFYVQGYSYILYGLICLISLVGSLVGFLAYARSEYSDLLQGR